MRNSTSLVEAIAVRSAKSNVCEFIDAVGVWPICFVVMVADVSCRTPPTNTPGDMLAGPPEVRDSLKVNCVSESW